MKPIFIGGCERSGTTLLASQIGALKNCIATPESQFKNRLKITFWDSGILSNPHFSFETQTNAFQAIKILLNHFRFKIWNINLIAEEYLSDVSNHTLRELLVWVVKQYAQKVHPNKVPKYWIDHTPDNLRNVEFLKSVFPEAKFIHIIRDPRGIYSSYTKLDWGPNSPISASYKWNQQIKECIENEKAASNSCYRVRYEDLLKNPKTTLFNICEWIGISFEEKMIEGTGFKVPIYTIGQHSLVGSRPIKSKAWDWKKSLTKQDINTIDYFCKDYMTELGYPIATNSPTKKPSIFIKIKYRFIEEVKWRINKKKLIKRRKSVSSEFFEYYD